MIINRTKNISLDLPIKDCRSIISKAHGLMFSYPNKALVFFFKNYRIDIVLHMFFVFYKILILGLDKDKKIKTIKIGKPFQPYINMGKVEYIIEIPLNLLKLRTKDLNIPKTKISNKAINYNLLFEIGDEIEF